MFVFSVEDGIAWYGLEAQHKFASLAYACKSENGRQNLYGSGRHNCCKSPGGAYRWENPQWPICLQQEVINNRYQDTSIEAAPITGSFPAVRVLTLSQPLIDQVRSHRCGVDQPFSVNVQMHKMLHRRGNRDQFGEKRGNAFASRRVWKDWVKIAMCNKLSRRDKDVGRR